jgi:site-specific DNA recombinase
MNKRAAIYARVSTDLQRGNYSIPTQISEVKKYADKQGYTIVGDLYVDPETGRDTIRGNGAIPAYVDDYSSRELSRPGLDAALRYLDTTGFDILVVHSLDRLARDPYIRQTLEREFMARDARVEFVLGNYEETPEGADKLR